MALRGLGDSQNESKFAAQGQSRHSGHNKCPNVGSDPRVLAVELGEVADGAAVGGGR